MSGEKTSRSEEEGTEQMILNTTAREERRDRDDELVFLSFSLDLRIDKLGFDVRSLEKIQNIDQFKGNVPYIPPFASALATGTGSRFEAVDVAFEHDDVVLRDHSCGLRAPLSSRARLHIEHPIVR